MSTDTSTIASQTQHTVLPAADMTRWYLAFSKPRLEALAGEQLRNQGFEVYLPLYKKVAKPKTGIPGLQMTREPMFPRYVFFKPGYPALSVSAARSTRGVATLVSFGSVLATVSDDMIDAIRSLELEREQANIAEITLFQPGTRVRLREAGLQSLEGLVVSVSSKRVTLLLEILGRQKQLDVKHEQLELV